jgi:hypothetical protein
MNWYKKAKLSEKPYRIFVIGGGKDEEIKELGYIMAKNANDARKEALNRRIKGEDIKARRENISKAVSMIIKGIDSKVGSIVEVEAKNIKRIKIAKRDWDKMGLRR